MVSAYLNEQFFKEKLAEYNWLISLFMKKPDYALIAETHEKAQQTLKYREVFISLAKNPEFMRQLKR